MFQSPRSGKFVSDQFAGILFFILGHIRFNPLDRGNLYLIFFIGKQEHIHEEFQSPRSGKFVSDLRNLNLISIPLTSFQSPRSGKFVSDKL